MDSRQHLSDLQRAFVPAPPLTMSRPRDVRLTRAGRTLTAFALLLLAGAVIALTTLTQESARQAGNRRALVERGIITTGVVTRLWNNGGDDSRRVAYRFEADRRSFASETTVSAERRRSLAVGAQIEVRFLPDDPDMNDLGGRPRSGLPAAIGPIVFAGLVLCGAGCLLSVRGQRRLLEDGRATPAVVTGHKATSSSHGGKHHSMTYEFSLPGGEIATGKSGTSKSPPAIGTVLTVIYDPDQPTRSRVYPLSFVQPA